MSSLTKPNFSRLGCESAVRLEPRFHRALSASFGNPTKRNPATSSRHNLTRSGKLAKLLATLEAEEEPTSLRESLPPGELSSVASEIRTVGITNIIPKRQRKQLREKRLRDSQWKSRDQHVHGLGSRYALGSFQSVANQIPIASVEAILHTFGEGPSQCPPRGTGQVILSIPEGARALRQFDVHVEKLVSQYVCRLTGM